MDFSDNINNDDIIGLYDDYFKDKPLFCEAFDELFNINKYKKPTNEDIEYLRKCLTDEENIDDNKFIDQLLYIFTNKLNVEDIRRLSHNSDYFTNNINVLTAFDKLKNLYNKIIIGDNVNNEHNNIIDYLKFLLFEPIEFLRNEKQYLELMNFHYTHNLLKSFISLTKPDIYDGKTPCILSFVCSNSAIIHELFNNENSCLLIPNYIPDINQIGNDYFEIIISEFYSTM